MPNIQYKLSHSIIYHCEWQDRFRRILSLHLTYPPMKGILQSFCTAWSSFFLGEKTNLLIHRFFVEFFRIAFNFNNFDVFVIGTDSDNVNLILLVVAFEINISFRIPPTSDRAIFPDFDSLKIPSLQLSEYPFVIKLRIFQGESLHFGYLCGHVYP